LKTDFIHHLRGEWPLALVAAGLMLYLPIVLFTGVFYTNQGQILRATDPRGYWRWVRRFMLLLMASLTVLVGSYFLAWGRSWLPADPGTSYLGNRDRIRWSRRASLG